MEQLLYNTVCGTVDNSDHTDCDCGYFDYTFWAIQLHAGQKRVQDSDKCVDQFLGCYYRDVSVNDATRTVTSFAVPRLGVFLCGLQHSVPGIYHIVSY